MTWTGRNPAWLLSLLAISFATGCATSPATLTVRSTERQAAYAQNFTQAFASETEDGTQEFILVSDDAVKRTAHDPGGVLRPVGQTPLRQVVYVRVLWKPLNGVEKGITSNASVDWYVFGNTSGTATDMLAYQGTAFATIKDARGETKKVTLREGTIKPTAARGALTDPIGIGRLQGTFIAVQNPHRLHELLAAARARSADASAAAR